MLVSGIQTKGQALKFAFQEKGKDYETSYFFENKRGLL